MNQHLASTRVADFLWKDWLPPGVTIDDVIALMAGAAMILVVLAVWHALLVDNQLARRLAALAVRRNELRERMLAGAHRRKTRGSATTGLMPSLMHGLVHQFDLLRSREAADAQILLARAGLRTRDAMVTYLFCKMCLPFGFGAAALIDAYWLPIVPISDALRLPIVLAVVIIGFYAPRLHLKNATAKRRKMLQKGLPDGLDLLVICAEAGLSLDATFARVARELGNTWPELADELGLTAVELTFLPERRQALDNLNARTNLASFRGVVNTLQQSEKFGTPLAQSLRVLALEFREQRLMRAEEKAARLPALLTVPMMVFILPTLFIVLLGPAVISTLDTLASAR